MRKASFIRVFFVKNNKCFSYRQNSLDMNQVANDVYNVSLQTEEEF